MQRLSCEFLGTALLLATVTGSGIMGDNLAGGNVAIALLANSLATGAVLVVLITLFGPVSGAHFNPAVTAVFWWRGAIASGESLGYMAAQTTGAIFGVWLAHAMFGLEILQLSSHIRSGPPQWLAEIIATFGLVLTILGGLRSKPESVPLLVGLYITAAYWFTSSTSFANPAVTIARTLTDTFAGIAPSGAPGFIVAQLAGAALGLAVANHLFAQPQD